MLCKFQINKIVAVVTIMLCLTLVGCASHTVSPGAENARIVLSNNPQASINVDASSLPEDRLQAFKLHGGAPAFAKAIAMELEQADIKLDPAITEMNIEVTGFRLRSTSAGFWLGAMAGADKLDVTVTLFLGNQRLTSYSTGAAGLLAGMIKPSAGGRFQGLIELVAKRIIEKL